MASEAGCKKNQQSWQPSAGFVPDSKSHVVRDLQEGYLCAAQLREGDRFPVDPPQRVESSLSDPQLSHGRVGGILQPFATLGLGDLKVLCAPSLKSAPSSEFY